MNSRDWPKIVVMGYSEAGMFLRGGERERVGAVVSIHGAREFGVAWSRGPRLDLGFDDVDVPAAEDWVAVQQERVRRRWEEEHGRMQHGPTADDARSIVEFAREIQSVRGVLLCHCGGGISRAPAAAIVCLATWMGAGREEACVTEILRGRKGASPHGDLVRFGDEVLERGGRLSGALRTFGLPRGEMPDD